MAQKQVELVKPYGTYTKGTILTLDKPVADLLIQSGRAQEIRPVGKPSKSKKAGMVTE